MEDKELEALITRKIREIIYGPDPRLQAKLDAPSQKQFRKRLQTELPHLMGAFQQHVDRAVGQRITNLEMAYRDLAGLCDTLMQMLSPEGDEEGIVVPKQDIIIPGRDAPDGSTG